MSPAISSQKIQIDSMLERLGVAEKKKQSGHYNEAVCILNEMLSDDPAQIDALFALGALYTEINDFSQAQEHLTRLVRHNQKHWPALKVLATIKAREGEVDTGLRLIDQALRFVPEEGRALLQKERQAIVAFAETAKTRKKLAIICMKGLDAFIHDLADSLSHNFWVRKFIVRNTDEIKQAVQWADMVWLEWANETAKTASHLQMIIEKPVLLRLHGYEVFTEFPLQIRWDVIDRVIFVAHHKKDLFFEQFGELIEPEKAVVIRNNVNTRKFDIAPDKPKNKNIAFVGNINARKEPVMMLQFFYELLKKDPDFRLHIRGTHQDLRIKMAMELMIRELGIENHVVWQDRVADLNEWLSDKTYVISSSIEESFHYAIGEGMAAGLKPVIHAWRESRDIWPDQFIYRNLDEFLELFEKDDIHPDQYRQYILDHYDYDRQKKKIISLINEVDQQLKIILLEKATPITDIIEKNHLKEFVVVDGSYTKKSGHSMMFARDYSELLKGITVKVIGSKTLDASSAEGVNICPILPLFSDKDFRVQDVVDAVLRETDKDSLLFFQTGDHTILTTIIALLLSRDRKVGILYHASTTILTVNFRDRNIIRNLSWNPDNLYVFGTTLHAAMAARKFFPRTCKVYFANQIYYYHHHKEIYTESLLKQAAPTDKIRVAYFGVSRTEKGFHHLPDIVQHAPDYFEFHVQLSPLILGGYEEKVMTAINRLKQFSNVVYHSDMTADDFKDYLFSGHVSLLLYHPAIYYNRLSSIFTESLAAGVPVILTRDLWYCNDVMKTGAGIGVDPKNPREVVQAVHTIANDYKGYSQRARKLFGDIFRENNNKLFLEKMLGTMAKAPLYSA